MIWSRSTRIFMKQKLAPLILSGDTYLNTSFQMGTKMCFKLQDQLRTVKWVLYREVTYGKRCPISGFLLALTYLTVHTPVLNIMACMRSIQRLQKFVVPEADYSNDQGSMGGITRRVIKGSATPSYLSR